jgi:hypothetical protein
MGLLMKKPVKKSSKKMMVEKKTGERYASKAAMRKHERGEGAMERKREYGGRKGR